jgi:uncharacterized membrane-anchored protein YitT (DUF2179 family)
MAETIRKTSVRLWFSRLLIAIVVAWNLQCALVFFLHPETFAHGFELTGIPGAAAIRGTAILFTMWNVPYLLALWHPFRNHVSLWESFAMQLIGLAGETAILFLLPPGHAALSASILRFIVFDAAGLFLLAGAVWLARTRNELLR